MPDPVNIATLTAHNFRSDTGNPPIQIQFTQHSAVSLIATQAMQHIAIICLEAFHGIRINLDTMDELTFAGMTVPLSNTTIVAEFEYAREPSLIIILELAASAKIPTIH